METNKKKLKQLEAEYASIKKQHEKGKNAVSCKTEALYNMLQTSPNFPKKPFANLHKILLQKNSLTQKAETILLSVTLSQNRNMISASIILSIILSVFHKIPIQIKNVRLSCRSSLRRHRRWNFPNCCWIQYDV